MSFNSSHRAQNLKVESWTFLIPVVSLDSFQLSKQVVEIDMC
jgi:hypothetical protein